MTLFTIYRPPPRLFVPPPPHDCISPNYSKPPSPRMIKSPSLKRQNCVRERPDFIPAHDSPPYILSPPPVPKPRENGNGVVEMQAVKPEQSVNRLDSFEKNSLESLPPLNLQRQPSNPENSCPESPISPLLTDPEDERSHSKTFSRSPSQCRETQTQHNEDANIPVPSLCKLARLSCPEWFCGVLGSVGAILFGSLNPLFAFLLVQIAEVYYYSSQTQLRQQLSKWCSILVGLALATILANFLQHFYFGIMGEKMTERIRRLMFSGMRYKYMFVVDIQVTLHMAVVKNSMLLLRIELYTSSQAILDCLIIYIVQPSFSPSSFCVIYSIIYFYPLVNSNPVPILCPFPNLNGAPFDPSIFCNSSLPNII